MNTKEKDQTGTNRWRRTHIKQGDFLSGTGGITTRVEELGGVEGGRRPHRAGHCYVQTDLKTKFTKWYENGVEREG